MSGIELAHKIHFRFGTNDVFEIVERLGISITYGKWFPVTLGEFDRKNKRITVNKNAEMPFEKIIAHELGHYFLLEIFGSESLSFDEEKFCDDFAKELLK